MTVLSEYIADYVKPTFDEFEREVNPRRAFLVALTIYHGIDRAKVDRKAAKTKLPKGANLRNVWGDASIDFRLMDAICHHFKHTITELAYVKPGQWNPRPTRPGQKVPEISIGYVLDRMNMIEFRGAALRAITFLEEINPHVLIEADKGKQKFRRPPPKPLTRDDFLEYLNTMVVPTFEDFQRNPGSPRHAFLACVAAFHSIDRTAPRDEMDGMIRRWRGQSFEFLIVDMVAHHFKHTKSADEQGPAKEGAIPLSHMIFGTRVKAAISGHQTLTEGGIALHNLYFLVRDVIAFLRKQADLLPEPSSPPSPSATSRRASTPQ